MCSQSPMNSIAINSMVWCECICVASAIPAKCQCAVIYSIRSQHLPSNATRTTFAYRLLANLSSRYFHASEFYWIDRTSTGTCKFRQFLLSSLLDVLCVRTEFVHGWAGTLSGFWFKTGGKLNLIYEYGHEIGTPQCGRLTYSCALFALFLPAICRTTLAEPNEQDKPKFSNSLKFELINVFLCFGRQVSCAFFFRFPVPHFTWFKVKWAKRQMLHAFFVCLILEYLLCAQ